MPAAQKPQLTLPPLPPLQPQPRACAFLVFLTPQGRMLAGFYGLSHGLATGVLVCVITPSTTDVAFCVPGAGSAATNGIGCVYTAIGRKEAGCVVSYNETRCVNKTTWGVPSGWVRMTSSECTRLAYADKATRVVMGSEFFRRLTTTAGG